MKKFAVLIVMALLFPLQACAQEQGAKWEEGTHYKVLDEEATDSPTITEFFSFWCPHCFNFEPIVAQIKQNMSDKTTFNKVHVNFMQVPGGKAVQDDATKAMMIGRALKRNDELNTAIFNYIHKQRASITGMQDLRNIYAVNDVEAAEFDKLASSFGVNSMVKKNQKMVSDYRKHLSGVPTFIVNGKYMPVFTREMTQDDMVNLIVWLSAQ